MRRKRLDRMECSIARALDVVGDPWTLLIVRDALLGVTRFEVFQARLQIPRATLTARLEHLCRAGILQRSRYQEHPPRDEYQPTAKGRALRPVVITLMQWGDRWARDDPPPTRLEDATSGQAIEPALVDRVSGAPLEALAVRAVGRLVPRRR